MFDDDTFIEINEFIPSYATGFDTDMKKSPGKGVLRVIELFHGCLAFCRFSRSLLLAEDLLVKAK